MPDLREPIQTALTAFSKKPLRDAAHDLFAELGYHSDRTLNFGTVSEFCDAYDKTGLLKAFQPTQLWKNINLVFQLTGEDIKKGSSKQLNLLAPDPADLSKRQIQSYLFVAIELKPLVEGKLRTRTDLCEIARAINRLFPMPALIVFKENEFLSIAITYRRMNKKDSSKDVVTHLHAFQCCVQLGFPEPHRPADFEIGDQSGHAPAVEVAFTHAKVGASVFFGE